MEEVALEGSCDWEEFAERTEGVEAEVEEDREEELRSEFCNRDMLGFVGAPALMSRSSSSPVVSPTSPAAPSLSFAVYSS